MKLDIVLGLQWGDEGKGKIVDVLAPAYGMVARYHGGSNAGHTIVFEGKKMVLNTVPSGIFNQQTANIIGSGVVLDLLAFHKEVTGLQANGFTVAEWQNLSISRKAHLLLPTHRLIDKLSEESLGLQKIGSTQKGISLAYADKMLRRGLRAGDILLPDFEEKCKELLSAHTQQIKTHYQQDIDTDTLYAEIQEALKTVLLFPIIDTESGVNQYLCKGGKVLAEGAQGTLLDIDHGTYPYVTSSSTTAAGACSGLGIAPQKVGEVYGIFKAYTTRVGNGPFPTELTDETGTLLRTKGHEFGAVTKRPRRTGWLDIPYLKYAIILNGVTQLVLTKLDVLQGMEQIAVCTHYSETDGISLPPYTADVTPVYQVLKGWNEDLTGIRSKDELPAACLAYIAFLEAQLQLPVRYISVGPDREQMIVVPFPD
ncbi:adenylosuccinate synthase [Chitinophaga pinensis]|uniref:Adenylosuccinate synthetase n=1 Tax=Chitinophaga pinensis (strain ATCC 43595 / DSM 2588 / LMG 13176 / NBRC 15968 / NCIMB 11800 / UQM 2034) TaxID=485918 RepID=A0A979G9D4_CHIPD|nr:adenylosuccinate synthase [Chitinophaga pinensis]ACU63062.1 adenylosuccinate synthetase [Chitinophaga pinensis DSM 2588]